MKINTLLQWLYPNRCLFCREVLPAQSVPICPACRLQEVTGQSVLATLPNGLTVITALRYQGRSRQLLLRYKFRSQPGLCRAIARLMAQAMHEQLSETSFDCVTYVPTGFFRLVRRGYDQSGLLARELGRELGIPCRKLLVKRVLNRQQSSLAFEDRAANVRDAYRLRVHTLPEGMRVLLVDDVITSGSTISSAAEELTRENIQVTGICMANAMHRKIPD